MRASGQHYRGGDGSIMGRRALGGEVDTVGSLELDLEGGWCALAGASTLSDGESNQQRRGRSPC